MNHEHTILNTLNAAAMVGMVRLYGLLEPYFDKSWPLPDIELVK